MTTVIIDLNDGPLPPPRTEWTILDPRRTIADLGYIPSFLSKDDPRPAKEQFNANYPFGGWRPMQGFRLRDDNSLSYPGDPPLRPIAETQLRDELILVYPSAWVAIIQRDRAFEVARLD
jgi:hypothetical protein